jgi:hypothetical protein
MPKASPLLSSFNAGELSPLLEGRPDFEKYAHGCSILENMIPTVQGPAQRRVGTAHGGIGKNPTDSLHLISFEANTDAVFVLELGNGYMRFWYRRKRILVDGTGIWKPDDGSGDPIAELGTPWTMAQLTGEDGILAVQYVQSNDVMWLVHGDVFPWKLRRIAPYQFAGGFMGDAINPFAPFADQNIDEAITVYASDSVVTGLPITLTASLPLFTDDMVFTYFYLEQPAADSNKPWEVNKVYAAGDTIRSDGKNYVALNGATSGTVRPTHASGAKYDGQLGVWWQFTDQGWGVVAIDSVAPDGLTAIGRVKVRLPLTVVGAVTPSHRWARQAWNHTDGNPVAIAFFRERLWFARGQTVWSSVTGDFENFTATDGSLVTDDVAITLTIASDRNDRVRWLSSISSELVGTASGEYAISELSLADPLAPGNIQASPQSGFGSRKMQPRRVGDALLYVQRGGQRLRECQFNWDSQSYRSTDLSILAQHLVVGDRSVTGQSGIIGMAYQREPDSMLWCVRGDGVLLGFTYAREQTVAAWGRHKLGGVVIGTEGNSLDYALVRSVASIPAEDGSTDDVYLAVTRNLGGAFVTSVEIMGSHVSWTSTNVFYYHQLPDVTESFYLDAYVRGTVNPDNTIDVPHLTGASVAAVIDGMYVSPQTAVAGVITVPDGHAGENFVAGLNYRSTLQTMKINAGAADGTSQGKLSRLQGVTIRLKDSLNLLYGPAVDTLDRLEFRKTGSGMNDPVPLFTGDKTVTWRGGMDEGSRVTLVQDQPFPLNVVALMPRIHVSDER